MSRTRVFVALVCGSRGWEDAATIRGAIQELCALEPYLLVLTGGAIGADRIADQAAREYGAHTARINALWDHGKSAGPVRNRVMLDLQPDYVFAFRCAGVSDGTDDCVEEAKRRGFPISVFHEGGRIERILRREPQEELFGADPR